jgi:hypothetical protein
MKVIPVARGAKLGREWFMIAESSTLRVTFVGLDEDGFNVPVLEERNFRGFKSSNPLIVSRLAEAAEGLVDSSLAA